MKEEYKDILTKLSKRPKLYDLDIFIGELRQNDLVDDDAFYIIDNQKTRKEKILALFDCLKRQKDSVLEDIEKIFHVNNCHDAVQFIRDEKKEKKLTTERQKPYLCFDVNEPVTFFTGREDKIEEIRKIVDQNCHQSSSHRKINRIVISGLGGIRKTQLVLRYLDNYRTTFDSIVWLNADSEDSLKESFYKFARKYEISSESLTFAEIAKNVEKTISNFGGRNIIIFDNADEIRPNEILPAGFEKHFFLITSRHCAWYNNLGFTDSKTKIIPLEALTEDEAVKFVESSLEELINKRTDDVKGFVSALQYFPLVLMQATSYIKMNNNIENYTIKKYLSEYSENTENAKQLLSHCPQVTLSNGEQVQYTINTFTTWQVTFDKIKSLSYGCESSNLTLEQKYSTTETLPYKILNLCAYFMSDNIPVKLFLSMAGWDKKHLSWAIEILKMYSLVLVNRGMMKIHKLVQEVTMLNLIREDRSEKFVTHAVDLLVEPFQLVDQNLEDFYDKRTLMPHLKELIKRIKHMEEKHLLSKECCLQHIIKLLDCIIYICLNVGEPKIRKLISEELLLSIAEQDEGREESESTKKLIDLAYSCGESGDFQTMQQLLVKALVIIKKHSSAPVYLFSKTC